MSIFGVTDLFSRFLSQPKKMLLFFKFSKKGKSSDDDEEETVAVCARQRPLPVIYINYSHRMNSPHSFGFVTVHSSHTHTHVPLTSLSIPYKYRQTQTVGKKFFVDNVLIVSFTCVYENFKCSLENDEIEGG